jgi:PAS domain S-box-containing protein
MEDEDPRGGRGRRDEPPRNSSLRQEIVAELQGLLLGLQALRAGLESGDRVELLDELVGAIEGVRETEHTLVERAAQYERALGAERHRYRDLFDRAPDAYLVTTGSGLILDANAAASQLFGRQSEHLLGKPLAVLVARPRRGELRKALIEVVKRGTTDLELDIDTPRGWVNVEARATAELLENRAAQIRWIIRDVTARKRAENEVTSLNAALEVRIAERTRALATTSGMLHTVLQELPQGVLIVGEQGELELANRRAEELLGYSLDEINESLATGSAPATLVRALLESEPLAKRRFEVDYVDGDRLVIEGSLAPVRSVEGLVAQIVTFDDVSDRERHERTERDFITNAAHELQTPIASIASAIEVLQGGAKERPEDRDRFLLHIERSAERLGKLTRALLILARAQNRAERPRSEVIAVEPLLRSVAGSIAGRDVRVDCPPDVAVIANRPLLEQALSNLGENAVKYTDGDVVLSAQGQNGRVTIDVVDEGPGITPAHRAHVFDRFYRSGDDGRGFGLGLSIVRAAVDALGGELELDTGASGTRVSIALPGARVRST